MIAAMKLEPGTRLGQYEILGELGRGGMVTVYRAYQPALEREVALKVLPEFLVEQPGFKARFHREAVAVARLQHPNILAVFDHGEQDGVTYIVSAYIEGGTLAARMRSTSLRTPARPWPAGTSTFGRGPTASSW